MNTIKHVIWDWNGTLLADVEAAHRSINGMLDRRGGKPLTLEQYRELFSFPVREFYTASGFDVGAEDWDLLAEEFHAAFLADDSIRLRDGAREVLAFFKAQGIEQSILSAAEHNMLLKMVREAKVEECFAHILGTDNIHGLSKSAQAQALMAELKLPKEQIVLIGDTLHDAEVAQELGIRCILLSCGHQSPRRLKKAGVPMVESLTELADKAKLTELLRPKVSARVLFLGGDGKGKSSSALGMILRAVGHGFGVGMVQFIKNVPDTGELKGLRLLPGVEVFQAGTGFVFPDMPEEKLIACVRVIGEGIAAARRFIADPAVRLIVLDEIGDAVALKLLPVDEVLALLDEAPADKIIVLTGHVMLPELAARADTVSEVRCIKHAYVAGREAQEGVEL